MRSKATVVYTKLRYETGGRIQLQCFYGQNFDKNTLISGLLVLFLSFTLVENVSFRVQWHVISAGDSVEQLRDVPISHFPGTANMSTLPPSPWRATGT